MPKCVICRDLSPKDCPGCDPAYFGDIHEEMFRDVGEPIEKMPGDQADEYYPGCYEG